MESGDLAPVLLDAAWITARIAAGFAVAIAVSTMVAAAIRSHGGAPTPPRVLRPGATPRVAAQFAALGLGVAVTAFTRGQAQAWLPPPVQAIVATLAALSVLFAGTFVAWAAWSLGSSFKLEAVVP